MGTKRKGKAIICIAMIVAVLASAVGVVSAADESEVDFEDQEYAVRIVFPNGEGEAYKGSKRIQLDRNFYDVNLINVSGCDVYNTIKVLIKIDGVSFYDLSLSRWQESSFGWQRQICLPFYYVFADGTANESWAGPIDPEYSHLTKERVYKIRVYEENSLYCDIYFMLELGGDCNTYCEKLLDHGMWDGESEYPNCACICEKGWERTVDGCVACEDICKEKGKHYIYDPDKSYNNACECKCEDGYEHSYYTDKCEKVECPPNTTNVADLAGSCPKDRKLNRHCCCDEGYINYMGGGVCIKEEDVPGTLVCGKWGCQEGEDCLNCPEDCICAPGICDPFSEYVDPETKCSPKVAYIFISSNVTTYQYHWIFRTIGYIQDYYRSRDYKIITVRVNNINDVVDKLSNPSTKAIAYFGHAVEPSIERVDATRIRNTIDQTLYMKYRNFGINVEDAFQRARERSAHPNLDYAYIYTCHSLDDTSLADYLLRPGGKYWGDEGYLGGGLGWLDEYDKPKEVP